MIIKKTIANLFFLLLTISLLLPGTARTSWFNDRHTLVEIDGISYQDKDYLAWWHEWREPQSPPPENPDEFIEWILMVQDAERMQLMNNPEYRHKVEVFLKFRTLMLLKHEEIDSHLKQPSEEELRQLYEVDYQPSLSLEMISLPSSKEVEKVRTALLKGLEPEAAAATAELPETPPWKKARIRPVTVAGSLKELFSQPRHTDELISLKNSDDNHILLVRIVNVRNGSDEDFAALKENLKKKLQKQRERELNSALFKRLREKYQPLVDNELLASLNHENDPANLDAVIIAMQETKVNGRQLLQILDKERKNFMGRDGTSRISEDDLKARVVDNIIIQTLVGKEALERHYEERTPFKEIYNFYRRNRLTIEWNKAVITPHLKISESEIKNEYEKMASHFQQPDLVDIAWVRTGDHELALQIQQELSQGGDFFKVMIPRFGAGVEMKKAPLNELGPLLQKIVSELAPGQVSSAVENGNEKVFVKLIRRHQGQPVPLEQISTELRKQLLEKRASTLKKEMLEKLKSRSSIKLRKRVWQQVQKKLLKESTGSDEN